jgi:lysophosphatidate acyltransferase
MVIIGNHQTELDVLLLGSVFPKYCSVTAKKSLARVPFLGWFMSLSGTVFIDRVDRSQAMKAFEGAAREMKEHRQNVFIFPEGTRSYAREPVLLPFKKGAFHLAVQAGVDICAVVAENYSRVLDVEARRFVPGTIRVKGENYQPHSLAPFLNIVKRKGLTSCPVLPPISTKGLTAADVDKLTLDTRQKMLQVLEEFARDPASQAVLAGSGKKMQ